MSESYRAILYDADGHLKGSVNSNRSLHVASSLLKKVSLALPADRNSPNILVVHHGFDIKVDEGTVALSLPPGREVSSLDQEPGSFDFVIGLEILGKLQNTDLAPYLTRLDEIARLGVMIVDVFDSPTVRGVQKATVELYNRFFTGEDKQSEVHVAEKLPDRDDTLERLARTNKSATKCICIQSPSEWLMETCLALYEVSGDQGDVVDLLRTVGTLDGDGFTQTPYDYMVCEPYRQAVLSLKEEAGVGESGLDSLGLDQIAFRHSSIRVADSYRKALFERDGRVARQGEQIRDLSSRIARLGSSPPDSKEYDEYRKQNLLLQQHNIELQDRNSALQKQYDTVKEQNSIVRNRNQEMLKYTAESGDRINDLENRNRELKERLEQMTQSRSWQMTSFLRRQG